MGRGCGCPWLERLVRAIECYCPQGLYEVILVTSVGSCSTSSRTSSFQLFQGFWCSWHFWFALILIYVTCSQWFPSVFYNSMGFLSGGRMIYWLYCFCFYSFVRQTELNLLSVGGMMLYSSCGVKASAGVSEWVWGVYIVSVARDPHGVLWICFLIHQEFVPPQLKVGGCCLRLRRSPGLVQYFHHSCALTSLVWWYSAFGAAQEVCAPVWGVWNLSFGIWWNSHAPEHQHLLSSEAPAQTEAMAVTDVKHSGLGKAGTRNWTYRGSHMPIFKLLTLSACDLCSSCRQELALNTASHRGGFSVVI